MVALSSAEQSNWFFPKLLLDACFTRFHVDSYALGHQGNMLVRKRPYHRKHARFCDIMLKPVEALSDSGKPGLEVYVIREIKPPSKGIAAVKIAAEQNYEADYEAVRVPQNQYGTFYSEELYIIIKTTNKSMSPYKEVHIWFGKDYTETPPPWINNLNELGFSWEAVIHFEIQNNECEVFDSCFKDNQRMIRYLNGKYIDTVCSLTSRFYKVIRNGRGVYRVQEIPFNLTLMNQEDSFILDTSYNTRAYVSNAASKDIRNKIMRAASFIREKDHDGQGGVEVVDLTNLSDPANRESCAQALEFINEDEDEEEDIKSDDGPEKTVMHSYTKTSILNKENVTEYPPRFAFSPEEKEYKKRVVTLGTKVKFILRYGLFYLLGKKQIQSDPKVSPREEDFVKTAMKRVLLKHHLETKRLYILEETTKRVAYLWFGKECDKRLQEEVTNWLHYELRKGNSGNGDKPARWTHAMKISEGLEPKSFRQYFQKWDYEESNL